ncbi:methyltransferase FkbM [Lewinellaceae bacterium SD302]|nr:methyltransferase FkbM [Lewinellaceae bacterium SD302]
MDHYPAILAAKHLIMLTFAPMIRKILYRFLSFEQYLYVLSQLYFTSFNLGLLKNNRAYAYPYFLKNLIYKGDTVIDIGANLGYMSVLYSKLVGDSGKVHSVEPVAPVLKVLRRNTGGLKNVTIYPYALGTEEKTILLGNNTRLKQGYVGSGSHFVLDKKLTDATEADQMFEAEMKRGSELFGSLNRIDFIKCDIEGFEIVVLPEMKDILSRFKPLLLVESNTGQRGELIDFFSGLGYLAYVLDEDNRLVLTNAGEKMDIVFAHPENAERIQAHLK